MSKLTKENVYQFTTSLWKQMKSAVGHNSKEDLAWLAHAYASMTNEKAEPVELTQEELKQMAFFASYSVSQLLLDKIKNEKG